MKIAYLLLTHNNPEQLARLVNSLKETGDFYIHIDKKSNIRPFEQIFDGMDSVYLLKKRVNVTWAGWSLVKGYMLLLQTALESENKYDRFVLLTGQDYPLMSNGEIIKTFEDNPDIEYVMAYNIATSTVSADKYKVLRRWYLDNPFRTKFFQRAYKSIMYHTVTERFLRKELRVPLNGRLVDPYFGQKLSAFTRKGAELILYTYLHDKAYNKRMKTAFAPEEIYWQTIIFNSHLRKNTIEFGKELDTSVFTEEDFEELRNCGYMFCKKVIIGKSDGLMDKIDELRREK